MYINKIINDFKIIINCRRFIQIMGYETVKGQHLKSGIIWNIILGIKVSRCNTVEYKPYTSNIQQHSTCWVPTCA
jgi:hypothetical protein